jgi:transcription elongation factor GreA
VVQQRSVSLEAVTSQFVQNLTKPDTSVQQEVMGLLRWFGRDAQLGGITPRDIEDYCGIVSNSGEDAAPRRIKLLKHFFSFADEQAQLNPPLAPHVKLRRTSRSATNGFKRHGAVKQKVQLTPEEHQRLAERKAAIEEEMVRVSHDIQRAAADKDVRENAPLEAARQHQGMLMAQLREVQDRLDNAEIVTALSKVAEARVRHGSQVTLREVATGREVAYQIVAPSEVNPLGGRISSSSPVGRALVDRAVGDDVPVSSPRGTLIYRIVTIE